MPLERLTQDLIVEIAREFPTLSNLNLSKNAIRAIDCDFSLLRFVTRLNLSHNQLDALPPTLHANLPQLTHLLLAHNNFNSLYSLKPLTTITLLDLSDNAIDHIDQLDYLKALPLLIDLKLLGNPNLDHIDHRRLQILHRLPQLEILDQEPISPHEREEARRFGRSIAAPPPATPPMRAALPFHMTSPQPHQPLFAPAQPIPPQHHSHSFQDPAHDQPPPSNASKQVELMQHRIDALQEILSLQEAELAQAAAASRRQSHPVEASTSPATLPPATYQKLLSKWRTKVFDLVVALKSRDLAAHAEVQRAARSVKAMEAQMRDHVKVEQSVNQRLADADAAAKLVQLQVEQLQRDRATLQTKCQRLVHSVEGERQLTRQMAHHVIATVQDEGTVQRLQHMYTKVTHHEQRLRRQVQHAETLVVSLARKEARLRNQEAALEGERRVWIKRLQGFASDNMQPPAHGVTSTTPSTAKSYQKTFKLKPESEQVLRAVFHRLDPYQTGLADSARFLTALQRDWTVRQALGAAGVEKLVAVVGQSKLFAKTKHVTWGEFVLLFLPDLSEPHDTALDESVSEGSDGVPVPFEDKGSAKPASTPRNLDEWTREQLECHVTHLEQERAVLVARVKEDASELQHRVRVVQQQWHMKCDAQVQALAALQETIRDLECSLALQTNAQTHLETQLADVRAQSATADGAWQKQVRELEMKLDSMARDHDKAMSHLDESHAAALQDMALQVRQAQKDLAKQDVYVRQLERHLKRLQDSTAAEEKQEHEALTRQLEKRDIEITKLRRERNALLTSLREQEKAPAPAKVDQATSTRDLQRPTASIGVQTTASVPPKVEAKASGRRIPPPPADLNPPSTPTTPASLSHRMSALSSQANRWLADDDDWASDDG